MVRMANMRLHAKCRVDRSNHCRDMAVCPFFKMAAVRHLGLLNVEILTAHTLRRANLRHHAKFRADRLSRWPRYGRFSIF